MEKLYYTIGEAAEELKLATHVLRYWESMFPMLKPKKSKNGNRLYREKELELLNAIKHLLYEEGYTIEGARKRLQDEGVENVLSMSSDETTQQVKQSGGSESSKKDAQEEFSGTGDNSSDDEKLDKKLAVDPELIKSMRQTLREILDLLG
ncbi:MerR family transcriptional regulator [bacterium]|nr:MerR family transcriptional regulator [bacterium]